MAVPSLLSPKVVSNNKRTKQNYIDTHTENHQISHACHKGNIRQAEKNLERRKRGTTDECKVNLKPSSKRVSLTYVWKHQCGCITRMTNGKWL